MTNNPTNNIYYVYKHTFSNGVCYIGKGKAKRAYTMYGRNNYWTKCYTKYGAPFIEIICNNIDEETAFTKEKDIILEHLNNNIKLCNITNGGEGVSGLIHSESSKLSMSIKHQGKVLSEETKIKIGIASSLRVLSDETKLKIGLSNTGKKMSVDARKKMSESKKGSASWNKGVRMSDEARKNMSMAKKGKASPNRGRVHSDETKLKMRDKTIYSFINTENIIEHNTQYDFRIKYKLSNIPALISGKRKSVGGWSLFNYS